MITLDSKAEKYWALYFAISEATADYREAPWYGPWNTVLQDLFQGFCLKGYATVTYPQFPISKDIDTFNPEDEGSDDDDYQAGHGCSPLHSQIPANKWNQQMKSPARSTVPSPEVYKGFRKELLQIPPKHSPTKTEGKLKKKLSTRIPDFVQLIFRIRVHNPNYTLDDPPIHMTCVLLLVEIKRALESCQIWDFHNVLDQTDQQARRTFAAYPEVNTLGLIIALGNCWTYREYSRELMRSSPTRSEAADPTYRESSVLSIDSPSPSRTYADVHKFFGDKGFAHLQDPESDQALNAIRRHL
jgi:hypothetical protein